jgi:LytS/YehU family sensor histidine kinase
MNPEFDLLLENLIDFDEFSKIQSELSSIVSFSVVTVNADGKPFSSLSNFSTFCQLIRSSDAGRQACVLCDNYALKHSLELGHSIVYDCHCGLKDCAAPIIVNGVLLGGVLGGQVLVQEQDRELIDTEKLASQFHLCKEDLDRVVSEIPVVAEDYIQRCLRFYSFFAEYIAEKSYKTIIQQQLDRETIERIRQQQIASAQTLKRIQAQMNPHFLFNALNSIARTALLGGAEDTEHLIYDLSNYLRYTIKNTSDTPTIEEELNNLNHYLNIQKVRFGDKITCHINVEESIRSCRIPSMTLQPLVENSFIHGLKDCMANGIIKIDITKTHKNHINDILIQIYDNGCGISKDIINLLQAEENLDNPASGLGLMNTQTRIKKMYGSEYGITIDSKVFTYTKIDILLPVTYH